MERNGLPGLPERLEHARQQIVTDPGAAAFIVEDLTGRGVAVARREPDLAPSDLAELRGPRPQQGPLELVELLLVIDLDAQLDRSRISHRTGGRRPIR